VFLSRIPDGAPGELGWLDGTAQSREQTGFRIDERDFVASNPALLIGLWNLALILFLSFSCVVASDRSTRPVNYIIMQINIFAIFTANATQKAKQERFLWLIFAPECHYKSVFICVYLRFRIAWTLIIDEISARGKIYYNVNK
jgi:hypothetical protein